jgi:predicted nucleic acid-binding protein
MAGYIIDTYAWVEYFRGSITSRARWLIESGGNQTPTIVLAELKHKYTKEDLADFETDLDFIKSKSIIVPLDEVTAIMAGKIRATIDVKGIGIVDCILLALARNTENKLLTGDIHLKGMLETEFL